MNRFNKVLRRFLQSWTVPSVLLLLVIIVGCQRDKAIDMFQSVNESNIQRLANLYCVFQAAHNFVGPKDEQEFKAFISTMHESRKKYFQIEPGQIDQLFVSERDKQPFKIRWELKATARQGLVPLVFEQQGVDGKYMIGFSSFEVREVEQFDYDQYWSGKKDGEIPSGERGDARAGK
jgi:hypothetical protein